MMTSEVDATLSFPRQYARTQRLTLGEPRTVSVSPDGQRVVFCRSSAGDDPVNCLWVLDVASGSERLVADPRQLLADDGSGEAAEVEVGPIDPLHWHSQWPGLARLRFDIDGFEEIEQRRSGEPRSVS